MSVVVSAPETSRYDIHGIVTIVSDGVTPELERFRVAERIEDPTIRVRFGRVAARGAGAVRPAPDRTRIHHRERLAGLRFAVEIDVGERVAIVASPALRHSPHVLYSKVVEPVLRWSLVERGFALVLAACMATDDHGFLILTKSATRRTMRELTSLDRFRCSLLSDHLMLVGSDGRALTYPEPVTLARRTFPPVRNAAFRRAEVSVAAEARLAGITIITGDPEECSNHPELAELVELLLGDREGSRGRPPDPAMQRWLYVRRGRDLRDLEREIVVKAIGDSPVRLVHSLAGSAEGTVGSIVGQSTADEDASAARPRPRDRAHVEREQRQPAG